MTAEPVAVQPTRRAEWRTVAVPSEHGGWGLTLEPVVLGLFVAPSAAGWMLGVAAVLAFVARTPLKFALVDARRGRDLRRTSLARRVVAAEGALLAALAAGASVFGDNRLWLPLLVAAPLVGIELWFDIRSRGRRLVPELAGAVGIGAIAAMIVLADGETVGLAVALWLVLAARVLTSIPFVRAQVGLLHGRSTPGMEAVLGDVAALAAASAAVLADGSVGAGAATVAVIVVYQRISGRRPPSRAAILGVRQTVVGLTLVTVTALGVLAP